jgi:hypothetical protein
MISSKPLDYIIGHPPGRSLLMVKGGETNTPPAGSPRINRGGIGKIVFKVKKCVEEEEPGSNIVHKCLFQIVIIIVRKTLAVAKAGLQVVVGNKSSCGHTRLLHTFLEGSKAIRQEWAKGIHSVLLGIYSGKE